MQKNPPKEELEKIPSDLNNNQLYERIYRWYETHRNRIPNNVSSFSRKKFSDLVRDLPSPEESDENDILFVANEILSGCMKWARDQRDEFGITMMTYARTIEQSYEGSVENLQKLSARSRLAWKYQPMMRTVRRVMWSLEIEELKEYYRSLPLTSPLSDSASKAFIIGKIIEKSPLDNLLRNEKVLQKMVDMFDQFSTLLEKTLSDLDEESLAKISKELGVSETELVKSKTDRVERIISEAPFSEIWETRTMRERLKPKRLPMKDLKQIRTEIIALSKIMKEFQHEYNETTQTNFEEVSRDIQRMIKEIQASRSSFETDKYVDLADFLKAFYNEATMRNSSLSAETIRDVDRKIKDELGIERLTFLMEGLELLILHYFMTNIRSLQWKPSLESFMAIVRQEFPKVKSVGEQAEIPLLRDRVCSNMGISEEAFDDMLSQAWERKLVDLDIGRPIGQSNVKYLKTKAGSMFFYVRIRR